MPGHQDYGEVDAESGKLFLEVETTDSRHAHIEDEAAGYVRLFRRQEFAYRRMGGGCETDCAQ